MQIFEKSKQQRREEKRRGGTSPWKNKSSNIHLQLKAAASNVFVFDAFLFFLFLFFFSFLLYTFCIGLGKCPKPSTNEKVQWTSYRKMFSGSCCFCCCWWWHSLRKHNSNSDSNSNSSSKSHSTTTVRCGASGSVFLLLITILECWEKWTRARVLCVCLAGSSLGPAEGLRGLSGSGLFI